MAGHDIFLYGATGYTGRLIADRAVAVGLRPVLAGRDPAGVARLAATQAASQVSASKSGGARQTP